MFLSFVISVLKPIMRFVKRTLIDTKQIYCLDINMCNENKRFWGQKGSSIFYPVCQKRLKEKSVEAQKLALNNVTIRNQIRVTKRTKSEIIMSFFSHRLCHIDNKKWPNYYTTLSQFGRILSEFEFFASFHGKLLFDMNIRMMN